MARYGKKAQEKVERAMHERKRGTLKSGRSGKRVTSRKQAIAIGLSEARRAGGKVPRKSTRSTAKRGRKSTSSRRRKSSLDPCPYCRMTRDRGHPFAVRDSQRRRVGVRQRRSSGIDGGGVARPRLCTTAGIRRGRFPARIAIASGLSQFHPLTTTCGSPNPRGYPRRPVATHVAQAIPPRGPAGMSEQKFDRITQFVAAAAAAST